MASYCDKALALMTSTDESSQPSPHWLSPFQNKSFRFQWPADLATSWAIEMELLVLGWYILSASGSVVMLVMFGSLQFIGTLVSPFVGMIGDRIGFKQIILMSRFLYAFVAFLLVFLSWSDQLSPIRVLIIAGMVGIVRPMDMMLRNAMIARTLHPKQLLGALAISRITSDSARVVGALVGAGVVAWLGMTTAYVLISCLYLLCVSLSLGLQERSVDVMQRQPVKPIRDVIIALEYVKNRPVLLAAMWLAFLVNLFAFPFVLGLLPYAVINIYFTDQKGLGFLSASFATGSLIASVLLSKFRFRTRNAKIMMWSGLFWFSATMVFAWMTHMGVGMMVLFCIGFSQSFCVTPLAAAMFQASEEEYLGRVMGMRMLAVLGLPLGLLIAGFLIDAMGYTSTVSLFSVLGIASTLWMMKIWREHLQ
ncbi:MAG: MFS transporter [Limnohabitans sp.]|nr:MFS transporter [Limnohabitans sp.]